MTYTYTVDRARAQVRTLVQSAAQKAMESVTLTSLVRISVHVFQIKNASTAVFISILRVPPYDHVPPPHRLQRLYPSASDSGTSSTVLFRPLQLPRL